LITFKQNLDKNNKIYIRRGLREVGLDNTITILWCNNTALLHPHDARLWEVKASLDMILRDMEQRLQAEEEEADRGG
jgi:hypothetical protein